MSFVALQSHTFRNAFRARSIVALVVCLTGVGLAMVSFAANPPRVTARIPLAPTAAGWSIISSPSPSTTQNYLSGVTCPAANECWAVGNYYNGSVSQTLTEKWDGTMWSIISSPNTSTTRSNSLNGGITCTSTNECWAVGNSVNSSNFPQTLTEKWDGTSWSIATSPNSSATQTNFLNGITCASANECWAVGQYSNGSIYQTLIEKWDGISWSIVASPNANTTRNNYLVRSTCASANECWAVGYYDNGFSQTLIEKWDGISWAIVPSPNTATNLANYLYGVSCSPANQCWAVGYYRNNSAYYQTLIEEWDGTSWSIVSSPNLGSPQHNFLDGTVTCVSANECWAVGEYLNAGVYQTLTERWDGASWLIVPSPNTSATQNNYLRGGVACASASECWAVGQYFTGSAYQTLIERFTFPLQIVSITHPASNTIQLDCLGVPNQVNRIEYSLDLSPGSFSSLLPPPAAADATGAFQYTDDNAGTKKFYRLAYP